MRKVISLFLIAVLISGCNRMADNVSSAPQSLNAPASDKSDLNPVEELCGSEENVGLYYLYAGLSTGLNVVFLMMADECSLHCVSMFLTMLKMVSAFSFPVYVYLTNPSFLSKSKLSLTALAADTCLSLYKLITKNPTLIFNINIGYIHFFLEFIRVFAYPHIYFIKGAIWK